MSNNLEIKVVTLQVRDYLVNLGVEVDCCQFEPRLQGIICSSLGKIVISNSHVFVRNTRFILVPAHVQEKTSVKDNTVGRLYVRNTLEDLFYLLSWYRDQVNNFNKEF